ncbi:hypothetical protein [Halovivax gelatinilyticus]|uniref:hypothetical protein n=1 Tax=Halovivax gelatinilyticus TaxID=2961597 RepID=UPI0020CA7FE9|nr:hypothetical protein [Halovivax gelatinilyticus]
MTAESGDDAAWYETEADALEALRDELESEDVTETRLAGLYEQVSTSPPQLWNTATAFIDIEVNEATSDVSRLDSESGEPQGAANGEAVVTEVSKLARGWWAPEIVEDCDAMITLEVRRGLPADDFASLASKELAELIEDARKNAEKARSADESEQS